MVYESIPDEIKNHVYGYMDIMTLIKMSSCSRDIRIGMERMCSKEQKVPYTYHCMRQQGCWIIKHSMRGHSIPKGNSAFRDCCGRCWKLYRKGSSKECYDVLVTFSTFQQEMKEKIVKSALDKIRLSSHVFNISGMIQNYYQARSHSNSIESIALEDPMRRLVTYSYDLILEDLISIRVHIVTAACAERI